MERMVIGELVVVEGIHDKQAVQEAVDADVWVIGGNRVAHRFLEELRRACAHRGVIVLTDPDGPGEQIRQRIAAVIPNCKHAVISRHEARSNSGVGVEHASAVVIRRALEQARDPLDATLPRNQTFSTDDLLEAGLVNGPHAAARRHQMGDALRIGYGNAKAFLRKLNALGISRQEWQSALQRLNKEGTEET